MSSEWARPSDPDGRPNTKRAGRPPVEPAKPVTFRDSDELEAWLTKVDEVLGEVKK